MSGDGEPSTSRRGEPRVRFDGGVRLRYRLFQEFLKETASNISAGGMFIRSIHPGELGAELDFEIRLEDEFALIEGRGEVVWVRHEQGGPEAPPGMGIRFLELDEQSRALVDRIVAERTAAGEELFDLETAEAAQERPAVSLPAGSGNGEIWELGRPGGPAEGAGPDEGPVTDDAQAAAVGAENLAALDPEVPGPAATPSPPPAALASSRSAGGGWSVGSRAHPFRVAAVAVISALLGAGAVLIFQRLYVEPSIEKLEPSIDELAGGPGGPWQPPAQEPEALAAAPVEAPSAEPAPARGAPGARPSEVMDVLREWVRAWSEQRVDGYLAAYAAGFEPPDGLDRAAWEASRRARIERPEWIRVALTHVEVEEAGPDAAEVRFIQSYRSERYKDLVRKRLLMVREDGSWKIAAEQAAAR